MIGASPPLNQRASTFVAQSRQQDPLLSAFISHAKADEKKADAIAKALEARGFKCWIAPRDVKPGRSYGDEIIRGIETTRSFVLVLSKASNDSAFVAREVERAVSKNKPIFPVRIADVQPAPSLELFISGTQWIDAFPGRLSAHVGRLANLLAEEQGRAPTRETGEEPRRRPKWVLPVGAAATLLLAVGAGIAFWPGPHQISGSSDNPDRSLIADPAWRGEAFNTERDQVASANRDDEPTAPGIEGHVAAAAALPSSDTELIGGGKTQSLGPSNSAASAGLAGRDPDFQSCETASGAEALAACDRAIASDKFTGRNLSYLYSDRGFSRMQTGDMAAAFADFDQAIKIDSSNFYAFWNRGAVYAANKDFGRAREDLTTALRLNPDKTSKVKIEEVLSAVTEGAKAADAQNSDPSVISDPSQFWNSERELSGSAASSYPADAAMPASPSMGPAGVPSGE